MQRALDRLLEQKRASLGTRAARVEALSPLAVLSRGYAMVSDEPSGAMLTSASALGEGKRVRLRFADGVATATVCSVEKNEQGKENE